MKATVKGYYTNEYGEEDFEYYEMESVKRAREMGKFMFSCGAERVVIIKDNGETIRL